VLGIGGILAIVAAGLAIVLPRISNGVAYPKAWDLRVAPIAQFVQRERGLTWKHPVRVNFLPPSKFDALVTNKNASSSSATKFGENLYDAVRALGVVSGNANLAKSAQQFAQADILGEYVDSDRTVYVRGDALTPYVRSVVAHELTHALQDQYFNLGRIRSGHKDDDLSVTALVEGDAVRVQYAYERSLSKADQTLLVQEEQQAGNQAESSNNQDEIPQFLIDQAEFPYDFGPTFVAALLAKGGNAEVDAAFRNLPTVDSEIVNADSYTAGEATPTVTVPPLPAGAHQIIPPSGFGLVPLTEMLGDQIGFHDAWSAVQGWQQDQWVPYTLDGHVCANLDVLDSTAAALVQGGRVWASHLPSATVRQSGAVVYFHSCDPGPAWKPAPPVNDPYRALAIRSDITYQLITFGHATPKLATCTAEALVTSLSQGFLESALQASDPNSAVAISLRSYIQTDSRNCAINGS
jgi:hypothetical protein